MIKWNGQGECHLTYVPRKPTSMGIMLNTMACSESNICLAAEIEEGALIMATSKYRDQVAAHTAMTLRAVEAYKGS